MSDKLFFQLILKKNFNWSVKIDFSSVKCIFSSLRRLYVYADFIATLCFLSFINIFLFSPPPTHKIILDFLYFYKDSTLISLVFKTWRCFPFGKRLAMRFLYFSRPMIISYGNSSHYRFCRLILKSNGTQRTQQELIRRRCDGKPFRKIKPLMFPSEIPRPYSIPLVPVGK